METKDIYWIAGLLEGEGWFGITQNHALVISIAMSDLDVMEKAARLLKVNPPISQNLTNQKQYKPYWKQSFKISVCRAAASWMMMLYPLMGERRKEQIRESLKAWRSSTRRGQGQRKDGFVRADCHPDRENAAYGLCQSCYMKKWHTEHGRTKKTGVKSTRLSRVPDCHPDRFHFAKGLCIPCYHQSRRLTKSQNVTSYPNS